MRSRGGDVGSEKGLSVFLFDANAMIIASGREVDEMMALSMSCFIIGDPVVIVRPGDGVRDKVSRTRAVTVWFFESAEEMINFPVRPEAPRTRKCISSLERFVRVVSCESLSRGQKFQICI